MESFSNLLLPINSDCIFEEDGYYVWCGSIAKYADKYYLVYSRWSRTLDFNSGWVTDSEICLAESDRPDGKFHYVKTICTKDKLGRWDSSCAHNPVILHTRGKYYLYYMGNNGNGSYWDNRNKQRIGVAVADSPAGEWTFFEKPLIDVTKGGIDSLMVSNPTVCETPDGRYLMIYKAVSDNGELPKGGAVICGAAFSDSPLGPFEKVGKPIFVNPENPWSVEDPFVWYENGKYFALCSDFHGYFTKLGSRSVAIFVSDNGVDWKPCENPLAYTLSYKTADGIKNVYRLERPQIYFENGRKKVLVCACAEDNEFKKVYQLHIPIK